MCRVRTGDVIGRLGREGYRGVRPSYVNYLLREGYVHMPEKGSDGRLLWAEADVDRLRNELKRRGRGPAAMPQDDARDAVLPACPSRLTRAGGRRP